MEALGSAVLRQAIYEAQWYLEEEDVDGLLLTGDRIEGLLRAFTNLERPQWRRQGPDQTLPLTVGDEFAVACHAARCGRRWRAAQANQS